MTYSETVHFLYSKLPYFTRDGKSAIKKDLTNTLALCEILGNPHRQFKSIHIAGTNGKGSVSNMLAASLQNNGYKTGLYTSPHLKDFRERIRINGTMVSEEFVVAFTEKIIPYIETIQPSFFEITVAMCFDYFAQEQVEIAVIETGLGGRLDSTNIVTPLLSVITNIGKDHADLLGDTLPKIAFEKAGIIKPGIPAVIGESNPETDPVFIQKAIECKSPLYFADKNPLYFDTVVESDLKGSYQQKNIITVLQALDLLNEGVEIKTSPSKTSHALQNVRALTGFRGRWETLASNPKIIADTGHNAHGIALVMTQLKTEKYQTLRMVFGMVSDKDRTEILDLLPVDAVYYFCRPALMRGLDPEILKAECETKGIQGRAFNSVAEALNAAKSEADMEDLIFIGGSTFVVAEAL